MKEPRFSSASATSSAGVAGHPERSQSARPSDTLKAEIFAVEEQIVDIEDAIFGYETVLNAARERLRKLKLKLGDVIMRDAAQP